MPPRAKTPPEHAGPLPPDPAPGALASLPGYQHIPQQPSQSANPDALPAGAAWAADSGSGSSEPEAPTRTDPVPLTKARTAPYEAIARGALRALGGFLNARVAVHDDDESFLPDEDDDKNVPPPVGRLMARRVPVDISGANLSDVEDIAAAVVTLGAWAVKGVTSMFEARREIRRARAAAAVHQGDDATTNNGDAQ